MKRSCALYIFKFCHSFMYLILSILLKNPSAEMLESSGESFSKSDTIEDSSMTFVIDDQETEKQKAYEYKLQLGVDDFRALRLYSSVFQDKSEIINEVLTRGGVSLVITRPKKWGKSVNIDMFKRFFQIEVDESGNPLPEKENRVLFTGGSVKLNSSCVKNIKPLKIAQFASAMALFGQNPVIPLRLKSVKGKTYQEFKKAFAKKIRDLYQLYPYLNQYMENKTLRFLHINENSTNTNVTKIKFSESLHYLSKLLFRHFGQNVYILIDDYDSPIANAYVEFGVRSEEFKKVVKLIYTIIGKAIKDNWFLEKAILVGTFHFEWLDQILKLNNARYSSIVDPTFSKFFGFTRQEVDQILSVLPGNAITAEKLKEWYNGYNLDGDMMYNPWSTLSCISNGGKYKRYWGDVMVTMDSMMDSIFLLDGVQDYLHQLLQGKVIMRKGVSKSVNLLKMEDTFHRVMLYGGYFSPVSAFCESNCFNHPWNFSIPNKEVRELVALGVSKWVASKLSINIKDYLNMTALLINMQVNYFAEEFQKYLLTSCLPKKSLDFQNICHQLVSGMLSSLAGRYMVESNRKPGKRSREYILTGRPEIANDIIIIEYEIGKSPKKIVLAVEAGLKTLVDKKYENKKCNHLQHEVKVYMVLTRRKVAVRYQVTEVG